LVLARQASMLGLSLTTTNLARKISNGTTQDSLQSPVIKITCLLPQLRIQYLIIGLKKEFIALQTYLLLKYFHHLSRYKINTYLFDIKKKHASAKLPFYPNSPN